MTDTRLALVALFLVIALSACEPTVGIDGRLVVNTPFCPVSDSALAAADSIPLGCPFPRNVP